MVVTLSLLVFQGASRAGEEVKKLLASYAPIQTVACKYRRTIKGDGPNVVLLSRVYFSRDDRLHVENVSPVKRRILSDGKTFRSYAEGDPRGFLRPVAELDQAMLISLRRIPGTPMEHLLRLKDAEESSLGEGDHGGAMVGVSMKDRFGVMQLDAAGRLVQLDFYESKKRNSLLARYRYSRFQEVLPGVWVPFRHEAEMGVGVKKATETVRLDAYEVNGKLAEKLFDSSLFFDSGIDFIDDFTLIYDK